MIDAKVATKNVFDYLHNLYEDKDFHAIELEEVELSSSDCCVRVNGNDLIVQS